MKITGALFRKYHYENTDLFSVSRNGNAEQTAVNNFKGANNRDEMVVGNYFCTIL